MTSQGETALFKNNKFTRDGYLFPSYRLSVVLVQCYLVTPSEVALISTGLGRWYSEMAWPEKINDSDSFHGEFNG